jgi:dTDP-4-amino-4,6-dideoxygalactose transaminase
MDWKVRYIDYPLQYRKMKNDILGTIDSVLSQGDVMLRQQLSDFETNLANFVGTKHSVGVSNCTDGLHLSLLAAGVGTDDEVITVSHTFTATAAAIHHAGAKPVLVDIYDDHNMNVELVESAITNRTKAIVPVHLNGRLCDMERLMAIAGKHNLLVIEDAAQALGASLNGIKGGAFGLVGCFSFYPAKLLGAYGDAGAVVTNSIDIADKIKLLRNHGRTGDGDIAGWSFNCRMDNLQAAILDLKLKYLPRWIDRRREIAQIYHRELSNIPQLHLPPAPTTGGPYFDVFQNYEIEAEDRDNLTAHLRERGVETLISWGGKGVHQFKELGLTHFHLPQTERMFRKVLMLPMNPELTNGQVEHVVDSVRKFYKRQETV